jgi:rRNA maturation protein Nop10
LALCLSVTIGLKDSCSQSGYRLFQKSFGDPDDGFQKIRRTMQLRVRSLR